MPGLKEIENIKKSMGQRIEEREDQSPAAEVNLTERLVASTPSKPGEYSRYSIIRKSYVEKGVLSRRHLELYKVIKTALNGEWEGEIDFGVVLETIQMNRASANTILGHLEIGRAHV